MYQLVDRLADFVGSENIILNSPVTLVQHEKDGSCTVFTEGEEQYQCQYVIMAIPPHLIGNVACLLF